MKFTGYAGIWLALMIFCGLAPRAADTAPAYAPLTLAQLKQQVNAYIGQERFRRASWGIRVESLKSGLLFQHDSHKLFQPASNAKMFTGAMALDRFGTNETIKTSFYAQGPVTKEGVVAGNLVVYGRGDPSLSARFYKGDYEQPMRMLVEALTKAGVREVRGDLVGDETYFTGPRYGSSWNWDDLQYYYGAEVSALTLQDNVIDLTFTPGSVNEIAALGLQPQTGYLQFVNQVKTVGEKGARNVSVTRPLGTNVVYITGSVPVKGKPLVDAVTVADPAHFFVAMLRDGLREAGIKVHGKTRTISAVTERAEFIYQRAGWVEVASVRSQPMSELVAKMMKPSQNLYAQLLFLQCGAQSEEAAGSAKTTEDLGVAALRKFMAKAGIGKGEVQMDEGSGLSRSSLVTPDSIVQLLKYMASTRMGPAYRESMPVAGVDGTLRSRLGRKPALQNVRAKTGTIRNVHSISGYATSQNGEPLVFSVILNRYESLDGKFIARDEVDHITQLIASFKGGE